MRIVVESAIAATPRVQQVRGMFDLPAEDRSRIEWEVNLPLAESPWHIGLIVGPSGCGKTTIARRWFGEAAHRIEGECAKPQAIVDLFPDGMSIKDIVELLSAVGLSSPPAWLRPLEVLSTGQQFRAALALALATAMPGQPVVFDEYTSVVDRTVARVGSAAVARTVRRRGLQFVAVTCHEDVEDWLQPDWVYRPAENYFTRRRLRRRPCITLDIVRCQASAWPLFAPHHYLNHALAPGAVCFLASLVHVSRSLARVEDRCLRAQYVNRPVAFSAWLPYVGAGPKGRREHRTVTLPDFQGVGIGNALSDFVASLWTGLGQRALSTTTHPAMIRARLRSRNWRMHRAPALAGGRDGRLRHATTRLTAGFEYIGPPLCSALARALLE